MLGVQHEHSASVRRPLRPSGQHRRPSERVLRQLREDHSRDERTPLFQDPLRSAVRKGRSAIRSASPQIPKFLGPLRIPRGVVRNPHVSN